jgi:hypothetical protein
VSSTATTTGSVLGRSSATAADDASPAVMRAAVVIAANDLRMTRD